MIIIGTPIAMIIERKYVCATSDKRTIYMVHCDGACQKLRNQMQNYLKYTNKTSGTYFPGSVIYDFCAQKFYEVV